MQDIKSKEYQPSSVRGGEVTGTPTVAAAPIADSLLVCLPDEEREPRLHAEAVWTCKKRAAHEYNAMASVAHKSRDSKTFDKQHFDVVIEASKGIDEKIKSMKESIETEKLRLAALNKLVQLHQGTLNVSSPNVLQGGLVQWLGVVPSVHSVETLTRQLEEDLTATRLFTGCSITDCRAGFEPGSFRSQADSTKLVIHQSTKLVIVTNIKECAILVQCN
ncbi:hypothetical protein FHG87_020105 [Trinorchestia longiramus]|nr:hypothetical protein FHG87_020105 [Trinorchestia longiramus]